MSQRKSDSSATELAHELRTPITAILGYTNLLLEGDASAVDMHEKLLVIRNHSEYLLRLVNHLLSERAQGLPPRRTRLDPLELAEEVASLVEPLARRKGLTVGVAANGPLPLEVSTDEMRLRQILINLLGNALKFTNEGGVRIELSLAPDGAASMRFQVIDTGIGMDASQVTRLFQPMVQVQASSRRGGGSGIGLTTSQRLARQLEGDLVIASSPGQGTTATISIPLAPEQFAHVRKRKPSGSTPPEGALHGSELLLAGARRECLLMASAILKRQQANITPAPDAAAAESALKRAIAGGRPFAAILIDEECGDILALARTLRALEYKGRILSLESDGSRHRPSRLEAGIDAIVTKPVQARELIAAILADDSVSLERSS